MNGERRGWIQVSGDRCAHCEQRLALDIQYHCVGCDHGVCALCVMLVRDRRESWCPACHPAVEEE